MAKEEKKIDDWKAFPQDLDNEAEGSPVQKEGQVNLWSEQQEGTNVADWKDAMAYIVLLKWNMQGDSYRW